MILFRGQMQKKLSQPDVVEFINQRIAEKPGMNRTELANHLCDRYNFVNTLGQRQQSGCLKALRKLEAKGLFELPVPQTNPGTGKPRRLEKQVPLPVDVPSKANEIRGLKLVLVETEEQMRIWNELHIREHPRGAGPLVGRQIRYLIDSEHGWLGGLSFSSSALQLRDRDRWIGWDSETRQQYLDQVVGMSRFLIRNSVNCKNLASKVLGLAMKQLPQEFAARYGFEPLLVETFVDTEQFRGTCFRAANWIRVGSTQGMGRYGTDNFGQETIKDIYVYPLASDFRDQMGLPAGSGRGPLSFDVGIDPENWAEQEFDAAPLGDKRLTKRLVKDVTLQAQNPSSSFATAAGGDWTVIKGHYRFIEQPDDSAVTMKNILLPHREQTIRRMQTEDIVLCIQDGTDLNYNNLDKCEGLGIIGKNQTQAKSRGLHLHSTLAVTDQGLPLGVLRTQCWAPTPRDKNDKRATNKIPIEEKEDFCWIEGVRDCMAISADIPHTRLISVMDREADFFELFDEWRQNPSIDLIVRAMYNRRTTEELKLFDAVKATEPKLTFQIHIDRQSARSKKSKQQERPQRKERIADVTLRYRQIELRPPYYHKDKDPITLSIVHIVEENPPEGVEPLEWFLLTTIHISSPEQAQQVLEWYCLRWRIEDWHRVLKSGCKTEELGYQTAERLKRGVAINAVIAWRIMLMTLLGRETPELPAEILFSDIEVQVLESYANSRGLTLPTCLNNAVRLVAKIGGYIGRKNDPPPGHQILWEGYTLFRLMTLGFMLRGP